jgi:hypothetical protein
LGVFLCIRCAGIHRNLGVHISKVKSVNLDAWTPEQIAHLQQMGNSKARAVYEANLPDNFRRPQTDSTLEAFIRSKYEQRKYIAKEWSAPPTPPPAVSDQVSHFTLLLTHITLIRVIISLTSKKRGKRKKSAKSRNTDQQS